MVLFKRYINTNFTQAPPDNRREVDVSTLLHDDNIALIPKPDKDSTYKTNKPQIYRPVFLMNVDANILNMILEI